MNTNNRDQETVTRALGDLRASAIRDSEGKPLPDVDALLANARLTQRQPDTGALLPSALPPRSRGRAGCRGCGRAVRCYTAA